MSAGAGLWLYALLGVFLLAVVVAIAGRRHGRAIDARFRGDLAERVLPTSVRARRFLRDVMAVCGLACLVIALAEPLYDKEVRDIDKEGVDLVLVVDLSRSMDAEDVEPSRLGRARREILDLVELLEGDRVGLVIYAGGAWPRMPLSRDRDALSLLVDELDTSTFQAQGSELGEAIRVATDLLSLPVSNAGKAIIVLSDGEVHDPPDALLAARDAAVAGVRIYTVGVGVEPAPIPMGNGTWMERSGQTVLSTPDDEVLRDVAQATGGAYVDSVASIEDMRRLYQDEIRTTLRSAPSGSVNVETWKSGFQWPLGLALIFLLFAAWIGEGRRPWGGVAALLLAVLVAPGSAQATTLAEGDALYRAGAYDQAAEVFTDLSLERPLDPDVAGRLGAARYRSGDYEGAARAFETQGDLLGVEGVGADYNAGNSHYMAGRLEEALARYEEVLERDSDHHGAWMNRETLLAELEARRLQQPEPEDGQDEGSEGGDPQDGSPGEGTGPAPQEGEPGSEDPQGEGTSEESDASAGSPPPGSEGQPAGRPEDGQVGEEGSDGETNSDEAGDGQERDDTSETGATGLSEGDGGPEDGPPTPAEPFDGSIDQDGPVTAAQAERLLEGVEEGRPHLSVPGGAGEKPW